MVRGAPTLMVIASGRVGRSPGQIHPRSRVAVGMPLSPPWPEGLVFREALLAVEEEAALLEAVGRLEFRAVQMHAVTAKRRIAEFGWAYGFDSHVLEPAQPIPAFLAEPRARAAALAGVAPERFEEALVTEYPAGAAIGWHRDAPSFGVVAGISLLSACRLRLRRGEARAAERVTLELPPRSAYVLDGQARREWQHSIPPIPAKRYSVTFRTLRPRRN